MVPKIHPLSDDLHPDLQSINSPPPQYSEWDETNHAQSLTSTPSAASNSSPTQDEADPTVLSTGVEVVVPCKGSTAGGLPIAILGKNFPSERLYARFGDFITCTVSEALCWLGDWTDGCWVGTAE